MAKVNIRYIGSSPGTADIERYLLYLADTLNYILTNIDEDNINDKALVSDKVTNGSSEGGAS